MKGFERLRLKFPWRGWRAKIRRVRKRGVRSRQEKLVYFKSKHVKLLLSHQTSPRRHFLLLLLLLYHCHPSNRHLQWPRASDQISKSAADRLCPSGRKRRHSQSVQLDSGGLVMGRTPTYKHQRTARSTSRVDTDGAMILPIGKM